MDNQLKVYSPSGAGPIDPPAQQAHYSFPARLTRARASRSNSLSEMYPAGVSAAPVVGFPVAGLARQWSSGLFDCLDDCHICCLTYWCPCITFGRIAEMVDRGATSCGTSGALYAVIACLTASQCTWVYSCTYRAMMRAQFGLPEAPCADCLVHLCCEPCALCQQYRELMAHGLDPVYGWDFNAAMYPPPVQGMRRR